MSNQYYIAGGVLLVIGAVMATSFRKGGAGITTKVDFASLFIFLVFGGVWYLGDIKYGNDVALTIILDAAERANGGATLQAWLRSWLFALIINFLPSVGQFWRWKFSPKGINLYISYVVSGLDWAFSIVGLYSGFAPFQVPFNYVVLLVASLAAGATDFWCQDVAQEAGSQLWNGGQPSGGGRP